MSLLKALGSSLDIPADDERIQTKASPSLVEQYRAIFERQNVIVTGIGARDTPKDELEMLTRIGSAIEQRGGRGRSGGAGGADLAFEKGFKNPRNIDVIVPWQGFLPKDMTKEDVNNYLGRKRPEHGPGATVMLQGDYERRAMNMAAQYHPAWDRCSQGARRLHTRNMPQVLGLELDNKSDIVIAWTVDGKATGGTGQAIRVAQDLGIPVANLKNPHERAALVAVLGIADPAIERQKAMQAQMSRGM